MKSLGIWAQTWVRNRKHVRSSEDRAMGRKQFLNEYNEVDHYRSERLLANRSHADEIKTYDYFWP